MSATITGMFDIAMEYNPALLVNALGVPPAGVVERVHGKQVWGQSKNQLPEFLL